MARVSRPSAHRVAPVIGSGDVGCDSLAIFVNREECLVRRIAELPDTSISIPRVCYATGKPDSQGETFEFTTNPWLNVRLGAQYVAYQKFNGGSSSYDQLTGGRSAKDNNTLYLYLWLAY